MVGTVGTVGTGYNDITVGTVGTVSMVGIVASWWAQWHHSGCGEHNGMVSSAYCDRLEIDVGLFDILVCLFVCLF